MTRENLLILICDHLQTLFLSPVALNTLPVLMFLSVYLPAVGQIIFNRIV